MEDEKVYKAVLEIDTEPITDCVDKAEQLIANLEHIRDLLLNIQEINSSGKL